MAATLYFVILPPWVAAAEEHLHAAEDRRRLMGVVAVETGRQQELEVELKDKGMTVE